MRELAWTVTDVPVRQIGAVSADKVSPQGAGTPITWTAGVAGGEPPVLVRFWRRKSSPVAWTMVQDWAAATTYTWTPQPSEQGDWQVKAEARSEAVSLVQASRESSWMGTTVGPPAVIEAITVEPAQPGVWTTVTLTPVASGGVAPLQFRWWRLLYDDYDGSWSWIIVRDWSATAALTWTPYAAEAGTWEFRAEARSAGSTVVESEKTVAVTVSPAASIAAFTCDRSSPQTAGTAITWQATATGGVPPLEYRFERQDGGAWSEVQAWGASNSYTWTPSAAEAGEHAVRVSVRSSGSTAAWEDQETLPMTIAEPSGEAARRPDFRTALLGRIRLRVRVADDPAPLSLSIGMQPLGGAGAIERHSLYTPELRLMSEATVVNGEAAIESDYVWFGGEPLAQIESATGAVHWYFNDHLGTPLLTTDASGAVDWRVEREPYGAIHTVRAGPERHQPLALPGQEDGAGELSYNIFRWYRSGWGRYSQADPVGLEGGLNLYAYVNGNPVRLMDLLGLTSYSGFPSDKQQQMEDAVKKAIEQLTTSCCAGADGPKIVKYLEKAKFVYKPGLKDCGGVTPGGWMSNAIQIGPGAFDFAKCCKLESTLTHEANHLKWSGAGEKDSYKVEKDCFGCGTGTPP